MKTFDEILDAGYDSELATSLTMADFNRLSFIEIGRGNEGRWILFNERVDNVGNIVVMAPDTRNIKDMDCGCVVLFKRVSSQDDDIVIEKLGALAKGKNAEWARVGKSQHSLKN